MQRAPKDIIAIEVFVHVVILVAKRVAVLDTINASIVRPVGNLLQVNADPIVRKVSIKLFTDVKSAIIPAKIALVSVLLPFDF